MISTFVSSSHLRTGRMVLLLGLVLGLVLELHLFTAPPAAIAQENHPRELSIIGQFTGDYPVSEFYRLPKGQRTSPAGFIGDAETFARFWEAFKPGEDRPHVDFDATLAVFSRNIDFYNRTSIFKVILLDGVVRILALETMSAIPIEDSIGMAVALIPRDGVSFIKAGDTLVPVRGEESAFDPLNATYTIEGTTIQLVHGRAEQPAAPGSATKVTTIIFGEPVTGDLDGDSLPDAALLLLHAPGGSGAFYYAAALLGAQGSSRGTNAVWLGDRVSPQTIEIKNGVLAASYADRLEGESMSTPPHIGKTTYMTLQDGRLTPIGPLGKGEHVDQGWVTTGHEVRAFKPCSGEKDLWLSGDSPAIGKILGAFDPPSPGTRPYTPRFMVLAGKFTDKPKEGFGARYDGAFFATQLVKVNLKGNCSADSITVDSPLPGDLVRSPITLQGRARGMWFFEGDFPVALVDAQGQTVAVSYVTAKGGWMTRKFVPFEGTLKFDRPQGPMPGALLFKKDNPTGLSEHDLAVKIPVFYE